MRKVTISASIVLVGALAIAAAVLMGRESEAKPVVNDADRKAAVEGNTAFALDLYGKLRENDGNLFFSPYSISTALAMTSAGARGQTLTQMQQVLHHQLEPPALHAAMHGLNYEVTNGHTPNGIFGNLFGSPGYQVAVANALWGQQGHPFRGDFLATMQTHYQAGIRPVDFAGNTAAARKTINGWVEKQTNGKIVDLLSDEALDGDTRLVLTNAIYFKGDWDLKFDLEMTSEQQWLGAGKPLAVPLMYQKDKFKLLTGDHFQAVSLPYGGRELSLVVFLPKSPDGLPAFEKEVTTERLTEWTDQLAAARERHVEVFLPRFRMKSAFSLKDTLAALGMTDAFTMRANLSGISAEPLAISDVHHQAFVEVNERGTEAAAATAIVAFGVSAPAEPDPVFRADHPFFFAIRDNRNGSILFAGSLVQP